MATCFARENLFRICSAIASFSIMSIIHIGIDNNKMATITLALFQKRKNGRFGRLLQSPLVQLDKYPNSHQ